jgi:3D (Asp-Asp-Asp) domain-containing protein
VDETDDTPLITASGQTVRDGIVATNLLPLGTKVKIPALFGDKVFDVEDRMNKRYGQSLDIWMTSKAKALYFGVRFADIVVLGNKDSLSLK